MANVVKIKVVAFAAAQELLWLTYEVDLSGDEIIVGCFNLTFLYS